MSDSIHLEKVNEVYVKVHGPAHVVSELHDELSFLVPNHRFHPLVKNKVWDGYIRLLTLDNSLTYLGLTDHIEEFCGVNGIEITRDFEVESIVDREIFTSYIKTLDLPEHIKPHDFQLKTVYRCLRNSRNIFVSPTGSGKSLIIYMIMRFYQELGMNVLICTESGVLVEQMKSDFEGYSTDQEASFRSSMKTLHGDVTDKSFNGGVLISTWQSIYKKPVSFFDQFDAVIVDEVHTAEAKCLSEMLKKMRKTPFRFGCSGTLRDSKMSELQLRGLFGPVFQLVTTRELIDRGILSDLKVKALLLKYPKEYCKMVKEATASYSDEMDFINTNEERLEFVSSLGMKTKGNTLMLFKEVDRQAEVVYEGLKNSEDKKVFLITGKVKTKVRDEIRSIMEQNNDALVIASFGTFSTGLNVVNIKNVVLASPMKSKIKILQSIGRGLRRGVNKDSLTVFDVADDLTHGRKKNFALKHFEGRVGLYVQEGFEVSMTEIEMGTHCTSPNKQPSLI